MTRAAALLAIAVACGVGACMLEKAPPIVMVRDGEPFEVKRVVLLPTECGSALCKGLDQLVAGELSFRGYEVVDLQRLNAIERKRTEVQVSWTSRVNSVESSRTSRRVEVRGPTLSDVDVWTLRSELQAMGVDSIVRVRTAEIWAKPARIAALVRVTRASDARLVASALCEIEVGTLDLVQQGAERSARCALAKVLR
jgi:hypothetical protein